MLPFLIAMLGLLIFGLAINARWLSGTALILLANWIAEVAMIRVSGDQFPWLFFLVADYLSALLLVCVHTSRWQLAVTAIYAVQMVCHAAFGLTAQTDWSRYEYWYALTYSGWAQLAVISGGALYALHRGYHGADGSVSHSLDLLGRSAKDGK